VKLHADDFEVEEFESTRRSAPCSRSTSHFRWRCGAISCRRRRWCSPHVTHSLEVPRDFVASSASERRPRNSRSKTSGSHHRLRLRTNLQHALALSRHLMRNERGERQIVVVTDGEPTAIYSPTVSPSSLGRRCAKPWKRPWPRSCAARRPVSRSTPSPRHRAKPVSVRGTDRQGQRGRLFYTDVDDLGSYALDDFVKHRRAD